MEHENASVLVKILLVALIAKSCTGDYFTSTDNLVRLFDHESEILNQFSSILNEMKVLSDEMQKEINPWMEEHENAKGNVVKYCKNPLNAFAIIKRNSIDFDGLKVKMDIFSEKLEKGVQFLELKKVVDRKEPVGVVRSILRLQETYHFKSEDLVQGVIDGEQTRNPLNLRDIYFIANESFYMKDQEYFSKSYLRILKSSPADELTKDGINSLDVDQKLAELDSLDIPNPCEKTYDVRHFNNVKPITMQICRASTTRSPRVSKNLKCILESRSWYSKIAKFKIEELNISPYIAIFHDVLSDAEVNKLIEMSRPYKHISQIYSDTDEFEDLNHRLSESANIFNDNEFSLKLDERFEDMTGLTMNGGEFLQIQNYGVGGHFSEHWDADENNIDLCADARLATILIYLSDVEKGGDTVFPLLNLKVTPKKRSALFWYNLKEIGSVDLLTLHSGCPVIFGSKWLATKWISKNSQFQRQPCQDRKYIKRDNFVEVLASLLNNRNH